MEDQLHFIRLIYITPDKSVSGFRNLQLYNFIVNKELFVSFHFCVILNTPFKLLTVCKYCTPYVYSILITLILV